jgi:hypothetical protein
VIEERKVIDKINDSDMRSTTYQQSSNLGTHFKDFDDWNIISDSSSKIRIRKIIIYADYYLCAMEIVYVDQYGKETKSGHWIDNSYISQWNKIKKCELEIDEDDYIEYISCAYSSQKTFIRSIRIATKNKKLLVHEGEIELKNKEPDELMTSNRDTSATSRMTK